MPKLINVEINKKINRLTIISKPFKKKLKNSKSIRQDYWVKCKCECGTIKDIRKRDVLNSRIISCGCAQKEKMKTIHKISTVYTGQESAKRVAFQSYKSSAKSRKLSFNITLKEFLNITCKKCYYCGDMPSNIAKSQNQLQGKYIYNGIDRIDNTVGYESTNMVPCCKRCNLMKRTNSFTDFIEHCKKIADYNS